MISFLENLLGTDENERGYGKAQKERDHRTFLAIF